jgi:predicted permease
VARGDALLRLARLLVRVAAGRVPVHRRERFLGEWDGELENERDSESGWRLVRAALGAFADANALRAMDLHTMNRGEGATMGDWMTGFVMDVGIALRGMRRSLGFTVVAVATLALGLGGSAALYTLLDRVVLQPLPYPLPERLVRLNNQVPGVGPNEVWSLSTAQWVYFTDHASTLESVGLYRGNGGNVMTGNGPQRVRSVAVTASMMDLLGARAVVGRLISPDDDMPSANSVAVLSEGFWERVLGGERGVVGTTLTYNDQPIEIIGVMDASVELPGWPADMAPDLWFPLRVDRGATFYNSHVYPGMARLAPGATTESAEEELEALTAELPEAFPRAYGQSFFDRYGFRTQALPLKENVLGDLARNLWILFGGVALVLLVACTNVANLFVVRMDGRRQELAIRAALGANRSALGRFVFAEGLTLALMGAAVALVLAYWAVPVLTALAPAQLPRVHGASLSANAVGVTLLLALAGGVAMAAYPLLAHVRQAGSGDHGTRSTTSGKRHQRLRGALVVSQVALAVTLVVGASLLLESLATLRRADAGVEPEGVLAMDLYLSYARHRGDAEVWNTYRDVLDRVRAVPGVVSAGMSEELPVSGGFGCVVQGFEDETVYQMIEDQGRTTCAGQEATSPGYFEAMGIPVLEGRVFTDQDNDDPGRAAVVVSRAFAERFWPGRNALGQGVAPNGNTEGPFYHVVGVVDDVARSSSEGEAPLSQSAIAIYYPIRHNPEATWNRGWWPGAVTLVVKSDLADPSSLFPTIRQLVAQVDPEIPLSNLTDMESVVAQASSQLAFVSLLLAIAAGTALLLAAVGLYGVISYVVGKRTREIGMRLAVGARPGDVQRMVVGGAMSLVAVGLVLGIGLSLASSRVMEGLLVGLEPTDLSAYVASSLILATVALAASWIPARRASRIDPLEALRAD